MKFNAPPIKGDPHIRRQIERGISPGRKKKGRRGYVYPFRCNHREGLKRLAKKKGQSMSAYLNGLISVEMEKENIR